ncbi:MAG: aminotransferase class V-fold PLP-dependent enzyme [Myxococcales bacterium]|nr:aminotransferase class V-fold PLP-dependent enzyme [Myxococcales bacterium]
MSHRHDWLQVLSQAIGTLALWEGQFTPAQPRLPSAQDKAVLHELALRLHGNYPFGSPDYAGQMLKPPDPVAWAAVALAMLVNPNNHALDGGPPTAAMEREVVAELAGLFGFSADARPWLGHLTASGTIANLEALWVAREVTRSPDGQIRGVAASASAHYTHQRVSGVLGVPFFTLPADNDGEIDLPALPQFLAQHDIGTVVVTLGTTGTGRVESLHRVAPICRQAGVRLHVDAAYGGFFRLLAELNPPQVGNAQAFLATGLADSLVVDPHKHGLQPYGCGCVLFADPAVGRVYVHDSPYTYFTGNELHLGEISLECSRAGAAAAGLWATLQAVGLRGPGSLTERLSLGRRAALEWYAALKSSRWFCPLVEPDTDILVFAPQHPDGRALRASEISALSARVFEQGMQGGDGAMFLARMRWPVERLPASMAVQADVSEVQVLRSVLMKPEHAAHWPALNARLHDLVQRAFAT